MSRFVELLRRLRSGPFRETVDAFLGPCGRVTMFFVSPELRAEFPWQPLSGRIVERIDIGLYVDDVRWTISPHTWKLLAELFPDHACATAAVFRNLECVQWLRSRDPPCPWSDDVVYRCAELIADETHEVQVMSNVAEVLARMEEYPSALDLFRGQEAANEHTENVLLLCVLFGTPWDMRIVMRALYLRDHAPSTCSWRRLPPEEFIPAREACFPLYVKYVGRLLPHRTCGT